MSHKYEIKNNFTLWNTWIKKNSNTSIHLTGWVTFTAVVERCGQYTCNICNCTSVKF